MALSFVTSFYAGVGPFYDVFYDKDEESLANQASQFDLIFHNELPKLFEHARIRVLDATCGIGTQSLGLAQFVGANYSMTCNDLCEEEVEILKQKVDLRRLKHKFEGFLVHDMKEIDKHAPNNHFDVVLSADNSVPHLLTDSDLLCAFRAFNNCLKPGGLLVLTVRDYDKETRHAQPQLRPYGVRDKNNKRYSVFQIWDWISQSNIYQLSMYFVEEDAPNHTLDLRAAQQDTHPKVHISRSFYYAVSTDKLMEILKQAGFEGVKRLPGDAFFQPVLVGKKAGKIME